jgi:hypothetical protein
VGRSRAKCFRRIPREVEFAENVAGQEEAMVGYFQHDLVSVSFACICMGGLLLNDASGPTIGRGPQFSLL